MIEARSSRVQAWRRMSFHEKFGKGTAAEAVKGSFLYLLVLCLRNTELSRWVSSWRAISRVMYWLYTFSQAMRFGSHCLFAF